MAKSLLEKIKARPPAKRVRNLSWWEKLEIRDPKAFAELENLAIDYCRGKFHEKFQYDTHFAQFLIDEAVPGIDIQAVRRFINRYKPNV